MCAEGARERERLEADAAAVEEAEADVSTAPVVAPCPLESCVDLAALAEHLQAVQVRTPVPVGLGSYPSGEQGQNTHSTQDDGNARVACWCVADHQKLSRHGFLGFF